MNKALKTLHKLLTEFFALGRNYSWRYASYNLIWWLCFYLRTRFSWDISKWALHKKTAWLEILFINELHFDGMTSTDQNYLISGSFKIWVFWGQGEDAMPPLVKACYIQLTRNNDNVCLVTNENVRNFIDLPEIIYKKMNDGRLTWAHFSDIVRTSLLAKYGGLWLDATVWVSGRLPLEDIQTMSFWSANGKGEHNNHDVCFWTSEDWSWSTWCMSVSNLKNDDTLNDNSGFLLFLFVSKVMIYVAEHHNYWPDYVFQDFLIHYACRHFPSVRHDMENMTIHNPNRNKLASMMNKEYSEDEYKELIANDFVFKLSYKADWQSKYHGKTTFYGRLILGE